MRSKVYCWLRFRAVVLKWWATTKRWPGSRGKCPQGRAWKIILIGDMNRVLGGHWRKVEVGREGLLETYMGVMRLLEEFNGPTMYNAGLTVCRIMHTFLLWNSNVSDIHFIFGLRLNAQRTFVGPQVENHCFLEDRECCRDTNAYSLCKEVELCTWVFSVTSFPKWIKG